MAIPEAFVSWSLFLSLRSPLHLMIYQYQVKAQVPRGDPLGAQRGGYMGANGAPNGVIRWKNEQNGYFFGNPLFKMTFLEVTFASGDLPVTGSRLRNQKGALWRP